MRVRMGDPGIEVCGGSFEALDRHAELVREALLLRGDEVVEYSIGDQEIRGREVRSRHIGTMYEEHHRRRVNVTPVTGTVSPLLDGSHGIAIDPFLVEHHDAFGTWTLHVELGDLIALEHAPRAMFEVQQDGSSQRIDASASSEGNR